MSLLHTGVILDSRKEPTSSHVSAPSKLPMVTSKSELDCFLDHAEFLLKSRDCFACTMMDFSSSVIASYKEANSRASLSKSSEIDG